MNYVRGYAGLLILAALTFAAIAATGIVTHAIEQAFVWGWELTS